MTHQKDYVQAYRDFRESVDFKKGGFLPDPDNLTWYLLAGVPPVPAGEDRSVKGQMNALDQRLNILKAVFVELNRDLSDDFLDKGLRIYDQAGSVARDLLLESD